MFPNSSSPGGMLNAGSRGYKATNPGMIGNGGGYQAYTENVPTYGAPRNSPVRNPFIVKVHYL